VENMKDNNNSIFISKLKYFFVCLSLLATLSQFINVLPEVIKSNSGFWTLVTFGSEIILSIVCLVLTFPQLLNNLYQFNMKLHRKELLK